ncbi:MAG: DUF1559 domain-containing protein [Planctomycetota bacterium]
MLTVLRTLLCTSLLLVASSVAQAVQPFPTRPVLLKMAPDDCLIFVHSFGFDKADPSSSNLTEQLMAEPEMQKFYAQIDAMIDAAMLKATENISSGDLNRSFGALAKKLFWRPMTIYVADVDMNSSPRGGPPAFSGGVVIDVGEHREDAKALIARINEVTEGMLGKKKIGGVTVYEIIGPGAPPISFGLQKDILMVTFGPGSFEALVKQAKSAPPAWLKSIVKRWPIKTRNMIGYVDVAGVSQIMGNDGPPEVQGILNGLGVREAKYASFVFGLDKRGMVTRSFLACDNTTGIWSLFGKNGIQTSDLNSIPRNTGFCAALELPLQDTYDLAIKIAEQVQPGFRAEDMLRQMEEEFSGINLEKDILAAIGDKWVVYQSDSTDNATPLDLVIQIDLKDAAKAQESMDRIVQMVKDAGGQGITILSRRFGETPGYSIKGLPVTPAFCVKDDKLIIGLSGKTILRHLKNQSSSEAMLSSDKTLAAMLKRYDKPWFVSHQNVAQSLEQSYPALQASVDQLIGMIKPEDLGMEMKQLKLPELSAIKKYLKPSIMVASRVDDGIEFESRDVLPQVSGIGSMTPILVALVLPAVQQARVAARRNMSINNMKELGLGLLNYESALRRFPSADENGLSWRVRILTMIGQQRLYDKFHLDEPWDSPHNKALIAEMPNELRSPESTAPEGHTVYLGVRGSDPILAAGVGSRMRDIRDGTSRTIMIVEADDSEAVIWTKPDDLDWTPSNPARGLGGMRTGPTAGKFLACFGDVHVDVVDSDIDKEILKALFTKSGGEQVSSADY